jgi:hypothetical protein
MNTYENGNNLNIGTNNTTQQKRFQKIQEPFPTGIFPGKLSPFTDFNISDENSQENLSEKFYLEKRELNKYEKKEKKGIFPFSNFMSQNDNEKNYFIETQRPSWWRENDVEEHSSSIFPRKEHSPRENITRKIQNESSHISSDYNGSFYNESSSKFNNITTNNNFLDNINLNKNTNENNTTKNDENQIGKRRFVKPSFSVMDSQSQNFSGRGLWT